MCRSSRQEGYPLSINNNVKEDEHEKRHMRDEDIPKMIKYAIASTTSVFILYTLRMRSIYKRADVVCCLDKIDGQKN